MENKDLVALDEMVNEYQVKEQSLATLSSELEVQSKQFANFIEQQKRQADELAILKEAIKDYMTEHGIMEHDTGLVELKLSNIGRYTCSNLDALPDDLCKIVRSLDNAKVKAYEKLNGSLPEGVESMGYRLTMKVKEK